MSDITISLLGIYNNQPEILDENHLILPEGVDRDILLPMLLTETAELEILYPEPTTLGTVIMAWSRARNPSWARMLEALNEEYNPLHNYDRHEQETGSDTGTVGHAGTDTDTGTVTDQGSGQSSGTDTGAVTGYNSNTFGDADKRSTAGSSSTQGTQTRDLSRGHSDTETRNLANSRNLHVYGNIGVTTSAQMLAGELEIRGTDIYHIITREFKKYFCILIY